MLVTINGVVSGRDLWMRWRDMLGDLFFYFEYSAEDGDGGESLWSFYRRHPHNRRLPLELRSRFGREFCFYDAKSGTRRGEILLPLATSREPITDLHMMNLSESQEAYLYRKRAEISLLSHSLLDSMDDDVEGEVEAEGEVRGEVRERGEGEGEGEGEGGEGEDVVDVEERWFAEREKARERESVRGKETSDREMKEMELFEKKKKMEKEREGERERERGGEREREKEKDKFDILLDVSPPSHTPSHTPSPSSSSPSPSPFSNLPSASFPVRSTLPSMAFPKTLTSPSLALEESHIPRRHTFNASITRSPTSDTISNALAGITAAIQMGGKNMRESLLESRGSSIEPPFREGDVIVRLFGMKDRDGFFTKGNVLVHDVSDGLPKTRKKSLFDPVASAAKNTMRIVGVTSGMAAGMQCHAGFWNIWERITKRNIELFGYDVIDHIYKNLCDDTGRIVLVGHAMGACLTCIAAYQLACRYPELLPRIYIVNFGAPLFARKV